MNVEWRYKLDSGSGDGILQLWIDGVSIINETDIVWIGAPCGVNEYLFNGYFMGWSNSGFNEDTDVYIDDVVFSTTRIGTDVEDTGMVNIGTGASSISNIGTGNSSISF